MSRRDALKQQLRAATESVMGGKEIQDVYLPQFVLQ
jgi:flagellar basal body-associated protein FliL